MPDVRVITNVGVYYGQSGNGIIYVAQTAGGTKFALLRSLESSALVWRYYPVSRIRTGLSTEEIKIAPDFNLSLLTDQTAPDFAPGDGSFPVVTTVVNAGTGETLLPRLFTLQDPYTLKGEGVLASEIAALKTSSTAGGRLVTSTVTNADGTITTKYDDGTSTTTTATTSTAGIIPTDFSLLFSNPVKFMQDNVIFLVIILAVIYFLRRKQKKPLWLF